MLKLLTKLLFLGKDNLYIDWYNLINRNKSSHKTVSYPCTVADLRVSSRDAPPGQNFVIFMQFSGKVLQIVCWHPL